MAKKTTTKKTAAPAKALVKEEPAPKKKTAPEPEPPPKKRAGKAAGKEVSAYALTLPKGAKAGFGLSMVYSRDLTKQRKLKVDFRGDTDEDIYYGTFYALIQEIDGDVIKVLNVYPSGDPPDKTRIDLSQGLDLTWNVAVSSIAACPVPIAQMNKWKAAGEETARREAEEDANDDDEESDDSEEGEEDEDGEDEQVEYE